MFRIIALNAERNLVRFTLTSSSKRAASTGAVSTQFDRRNAYPAIGNREIVGYGANGQPQYFDHGDTPCPAIRWQEETADILALREKEQGDWSKLTLDEKKKLYRYSFRQTLIEMEAPDHEDRMAFGMILGFVGAATIAYILLRKMMYDYPQPSTLNEEHQARMLERVIAEGHGRVEGPASNWDYEKGDWKWNVAKQGK